MGAFFQELLTAGVYKRSQGRITRQVTFAALAIIFTLGYFRLFQTIEGHFGGNAAFGIAYWLPGVLCLVSWWLSFRIVNMPSFADFLIAVEAEINKVSWPTRSELIRASLVVLVCIIAMAVVLFAYDNIWQLVFRGLGIYS